MNDAKVFSNIIEINKLDELNRFKYPGWVFRGEKGYKQSLLTSLERFSSKASHYGAVPWDAQKCEQTLLREFQRRYHHYSYSEPEPIFDLEWLSIMRHHGAPTRLIDFTYSIYVAAYFAVEAIGENEDSFIYGINMPWCQNEAG